MSNKYLLPIEDIEHARKRGWCVAHVIDEKTTAVSVQVLPLVFDETWCNVDTTRRLVIQQAMTGDAVAIRALRLMAEWNTRTQHKRKKK